MRFTDEVERWADVRNTSTEIAQAILEHVDFDEDAAQVIWQDGCDTETNDKIMARAWALADADTEKLFWGEATETRPA
jgi:hypothetical protein